MAHLTPNFDKFELAAFKSAGHSKIKVFLWALALLSGRYKQGQKQLEDKTTGAMCCVGVLCRINGLERTVGPDLVKYNRSAFWIDPTEVLGGKYSYDFDDYPDFATKNDVDGATFREIGLFLLRSLFPIKSEKDARYEQR